MLASKRRKLLLPIERLLEVGDQIVRSLVQVGDRITTENIRTTR